MPALNDELLALIASSPAALRPPPAREGPGSAVVGASDAESDDTGTTSLISRPRIAPEQASNRDEKHTMKLVPAGWPRASTCLCYGGGEGRGTLQYITANPCIGGRMCTDRGSGLYRRCDRKKIFRCIVCASYSVSYAVEHGFLVFSQFSFGKK